MAQPEDQALDGDWAAALAEQSSGAVKAAAAGDGGEASLADEWGAALAEQGSTDASDMAAEWATMIEEGAGDANDLPGADRILSQGEIDQLVGFSLHELSATGAGGIRAIVDSGTLTIARVCWPCALA